MMKINELYIQVNTSRDTFTFRDTFEKGLNIITSYTNTKGKSTVGESILFCLGLEEILGQKNEKAVKPVLRSLIEKNGKEEVVIQSDIFLEVQNNDDKIITIRRSPLHNTREVKLISVYENTLEQVMAMNCKFKDYFVHDSGGAKNIRGFHNFLEQFIGYKLPQVSTYDGNDIKLYIQTLAPSFYIEQKKGWINILATMPTYFKIKDSKRRVLEYVLGLSVLETEKAYNDAKARLKDKESEWRYLYNIILSKSKTLHGFSVQGLQEKPYIIPEGDNLKVFKVENTQMKSISEIIKEIELKINELKGITEPRIENMQESLKNELFQLEELFNKFSVRLTDTISEYNLEKEQLESIKNRIKFITLDLQENKDLKKLMDLGSLESTSLVKSKCPTCGQRINDTLLEQSGEMKIMTIEESIHCLTSEKIMLEFSLQAQDNVVQVKKDAIEKLKQRINDIADRIRVVKGDLISNNKALSQSHVQNIVNLEIDKKNLIEYETTLNEAYKKLRKLGKEWGQAREAFLKIPSNLLNDKDIEIFTNFKVEFKRLLRSFQFESTDIDSIYIDEYNYLPSVKGFDLYSDSSASDTIRIIWAYIIALQKISKVYGNNIGFLVLDEPAQQNTDVRSAKELLKELQALSEEQQIFVFYKMEEIENLLEVLPKGKFKRIHADRHLIACDTKEV